MDILLHTPKWVFLLFFFLLYLSYIQINDRKLSKSRVFIVPIVMVCFSVFSIFSTFDLNLKNILIYILSLALGIFLNKILRFPSILKVENGFFLVKGGFHYPILIMCVFFTKYFLGVISSVNPTLLLQNNFIISMLVLFGIYTGIFFRRLILIYKLSKGFKF